MIDCMTGRCMCRKISYACNACPLITVICHCKDCQKYSGSAFATAIFFDKLKVEIEGKLSHFDKPTDSGSIMTRSFCNTCGTHIIESSTAYPDLVAVHAGTLDNFELVTPEAQCWTPRAIDWTANICDLEKFVNDPNF